MPYFLQKLLISENPAKIRGEIKVNGVVFICCVGDVGGDRGGAGRVGPGRGWGRAGPGRWRVAKVTKWDVVFGFLALLYECKYFFLHFFEFHFVGLFAQC